ncbi:MAG: DNA repair exonuclease, partial [Saprospiraceae bacterium]|nr:DNA repair exonuclease [Saprospiraceae bacterium]
ILFFADSHLGFDFPVRPRSKTKRRGGDFFTNFEYILQTALEQQVDLVIHGGDLFDRSKVHPSIVNKAYDRLFDFVDSGIPLALIPGNHDRSTLPTSLFLQHPNLYIFYEPRVYNLNLKNQFFQIAGFPFIRNIGQEIISVVDDLEKRLSKGSTSLLCMHQAIQGATVGPANYTFHPGPQVISKKDLKSSFNLYLSGHIHRHQIIHVHHEDRSTPFIYPGSIERTSFAERDEEKGFVYLEFNSKETPRITFEQLPSRPMQQIKIEDKITSKSQLVSLLRSQVKAVDQRAILQISSPTETISTWLKEEIFKLVPESIHLQLRHQWIKTEFRSGKISGRSSISE